MAGSLKNISGLLSPKFVSPRLSPKHILPSSKSEGNRDPNKINRPVSSRKLEFTPNDKFLRVPTNCSANFDRKSGKDLEINFVIKDVVSAKKSLELNTPNKKTLLQEGLGELRKNTTILGKGSFGTVFQGVYGGQKVAVKVVAKETSNNEKNALSLNHANIIKTLDIIKNPDFPKYNLIITEHLPNCTNLHDVLERFDGNGDRTLLLRFAKDITNGLHYCHLNNVLHLDLKPKNILVDSGNTCKICDFGNSARVGENLNNFKHKGTVIYTAPEILLGNSPSMKSDIYSLGVIFWQIKYREIPFRAYDNCESIIYNVAKYNTRPSYDENSSDLFTNIFTKCWNANPKVRPSTNDILEALEVVDI